MQVTTTPNVAASKSAYVLRRLHRDIVAGALAPDQKLSFELLTERYEVGVSPLREALCQLVGQGLVVLESQRGFRVASMSLADLRDVAATRVHLEVFAFALSVRHGDAAWRREVQDAVDAFARVAAREGDRRPINESWESVHRRFHFSLMGACGSPILLQLSKQIYDRFDRYRRLCISEQATMFTVAADHLDMTEAALSGDVARCEHLLRAHLQAITSLVVERYPQRTGSHATA